MLAIILTLQGQKYAGESLANFTKHTEAPTNASIQTPSRTGTMPRFIPILHPPSGSDQMLAEG